MKKSRFSESQIVSILNQQEQGMKVLDICRQHEIAPATFYNWKAKYGGMEVSDLKRMKELEGGKRSLEADVLRIESGPSCAERCR